MGRWMSYYFEQKKEGILSEPFSVDDAIPKPVCGIVADGILGAIFLQVTLLLNSEYYYKKMSYFFDFIFVVVGLYGRLLRFFKGL